jgi:hypothetical protein
LDKYLSSNSMIVCCSGKIFAVLIGLTIITGPPQAVI